MKKFKIILSVILTIVICFLTGCTKSNNKTVDNSSLTAVDSSNNTSETIENGLEKIKVHFIDVGQGDSIFLELTANRTMLIDASESKYSGTIINYIKNLGYKKIDYVVATHPHADHIGGMEDVIRTFDIGSVYMPKVSTNTKTFESLLKTVQSKNLKINTAKSGVKIIDENDISIKVLSPVADQYNNLNDYSVVLKLTYKNSKFLFMGDAEEQAEELITDDVSCDLIKLGHHGSSTSSSIEFAKKTKAKYAVISCGEGNSYGHPHKETLDRFTALGAVIYRTDVNGSIIATCDGNNISILTTNKAVTPQAVYSSSESTNNNKVKYVLNTSTKKIHLPECRHVSSIKTQNRTESTKSIEELGKDGYSVCKVCIGG